MVGVIQRNKTLIFLLLILTIASFFRLWQLDIIPPGLYPDEAINGNEAITSPGKIFYPENNGREGLFINLLFLSFSIFGVSIWALRFVPAVIGILTVVGFYFLVKEIFKIVNCQKLKINPELITFFSSFFLATSFWHVNFSRIGFRAILVPFVLIFSFYFLFRGFRTHKIWNFILGGIFFGLGFYTYISFRMAVLLLGLVLILWWFIYKKQNLKKKFLIFAFSFLIVTFFVALPVGVYFLQNPQDFISRAGPISVFSQENPAKALGLSLVEHLGMFNFYGDPNWRHNISGSPVLFWPVGILFLIGLIFSIYRIYKSIKIPSPERSRIFALFVFLTGWWLIMLLPAILSYEGIPHSLRSIGSLPPVFIFSGLGLGFLYQNIKERIKIKKGSVGFCLIIFSLILLAVSFLFGEFYRYFVTWGKSGEVENAFSKNYVETGNYLNSLPANIEKYVIINQAGVPVPWPDGLPMPAQTVMFVEQTKFREPQSTYLIPEKLDKIKKTEKETVISLLQYDENLINDLYLKFPQGKIQEENGRWLFKINF